MKRITTTLAALALTAGAALVQASPAEAAQTSRHCGIVAAWEKTTQTKRGIKVTLWTAPLEGQGMEVCVKAQDLRHRRGSVKLAVYIYGVEDNETRRAVGANSAYRYTGTGLTVNDIYVRASTGRAVNRLVWSPSLPTN